MKNKTIPVEKIIEATKNYDKSQNYIELFVSFVKYLENNKPNQLEAENVA